MSVVNMKASWGSVTSWLFEEVVAAGIDSFYERAVQEVAVEVTDGVKILEVGCGQGQLAVRLAQRLPSCSVIGIDQSPEMIRRAVARSPRLPNLELRRADVMSLPFADDQFAMVLAVASIKHWIDRLRGVQEMLRVLVPGGKMGIVDVDRDCSRARATRFVEKWRHIPPSSIPFLAKYFQSVVAHQSISLDELVGVLTRAGVVGLEARRYADLPFVFARAAKPQGSALAPGGDETPGAGEVDGAAR
jgi:ubiquinone/menaquinone biosynthesis C-methylase UbiE